jgi:hypothetical protein
VPDGDLACKIYNAASRLVRRECCIRTRGNWDILAAEGACSQRSEAGARHGIVREARVVDSLLPHSAAATIHGSIGTIGFSSLIHTPLESPTSLACVNARAFSMSIVEVEKQVTFERSPCA